MTSPSEWAGLSPAAGLEGPAVASHSLRAVLGPRHPRKAQPLPSTKVAFVPPKPKEFDSAVRSGRDSGRTTGG